jgi:adenine phosphoribosyltransferase
MSETCSVPVRENGQAAREVAAALHLMIADFDGRPTSRVTGIGGRSFEFFPTAITDNIPPLHPDLSRAVCRMSHFHLEHVARATLGVGEEDRGAMIISDLLFHHELPRTLARWTPTGTPGEIQVPLANEYIPEGRVDIFLNGVRAGDRVILVDDLVSTGGTLVALIEAVRRAGAEILEVLTVAEKTENRGRENLLRRTGLRVKTMLATTLVETPHGIRSKVVRAHLGHMPDELAREVAALFPDGFCVMGCGEGAAA